MRKTLAILATVLASCNASAGQASQIVNITGQITGECFLNTQDIDVGSQPLSTIANASTSVTWTINCSAPMAYTIFPDYPGNGQWSYNGGKGKNVAAATGTAWLTLKLNGTDFPISGLPRSSSGGIESLAIEAKLIPVNNYTGQVNQTIQPTIQW